MLSEFDKVLWPLHRYISNNYMVFTGFSIHSRRCICKDGGSVACIGYNVRILW